MPKRPYIEAIVALAEVQTGVKGGSAKVPLMMGKGKTKHRAWTPEEQEFLKEHHGRLSEAEIGRRLGRSAVAVHIQSERELRLVRPTKDPSILTAEHVAMGLGVDGKSIHMLMDRGLMPCRRLPSRRPVRMIERLIFIHWMLDPMHWCYFKPERVGTLRSRGKRGYTPVYDYTFWKEARRLVKAAMRKWKDKWLTARQAGDALGIHYHNINSAIRTGNLQATRWQNWCIRRSALPKGLKFNAKGQLVKKIYPQGKNPRATKAISTWWKGKKRQWPGGPVVVKKVRRQTRKWK